MAVPEAERARYVAWIIEGRAVRQAHGILAEWVLEPSTGGGDTVVVTVWPTSEVFDAWIATPDRDRLTASDVHRAVDYRPITRYEVIAGYTNLPGLPAVADQHPTKEHHTRPLRDESAQLEFGGPTCNLRDIDLGIAVGSAAKTAAIHSIDCRCQTRAVVAARKLGIITADIGVALSLSMTHKAIGFDRRMPDIDFDTLDLPPTGTLPVGVPGATRHSGARNKQQPRHPLTATAPPSGPAPS